VRVENRPLWDIPRSELPVLASDIDERIRVALKAAGVVLSSPGSIKVTGWVPAGNRYTSMVALAGLHSRALVRGERTFMEGVREMESWVENFTKKVAGDDVTVEKAVGKLIEFFVRDVGSGNRALAPNWDDGLTAELKEKLGLEFGDEQKQKTCSDILEFLTKGTLETEAPDSAEMFDLVNRGLAMVARSTALTPPSAAGGAPERSRP
jgi:hypothetical protein